eukprot:scaffold359022_cov24-Prasinocladus_malaysianus.AAC.1
MGKNKFKQPGALAGAPGNANRPIETSPATKNRRKRKESAQGSPALQKPKKAKRNAVSVSQSDAPEDSEHGRLPFKLAIQPVKAKYGGMGFARPSAFLDLRDDGFNEKFEEIYYEH